MATKKYLDSDGLVQYTGKVKKAINDASYTHGVTDIDGTTTAPSVDNTVNATANQRSAAFTKNGSSDSFPYYDTTYGNAVAGSKDGLMSRSDKTKLDGIATGAEVNVQSDWNQTTTTADDYIKNKPAVNKVKQTEKSDDKSYKIVMSDAATSTDDEVELTTQIAHNPSTRVTTFHTTSGQNTVDVKIESGGVTMGSGSINATSYTGTAAKATADADGNTISSTYAKLSNLASDDAGTTGFVGADLIGYAIDATVKDAISDLYNTIGGGGGSSVMDLIEDLQDGENLVEGTNVTLTKNTTNHTVTIAAADEKVKHTSDSSSTTAIPMLLAGTTTNNGIASAKYNTNLSFKPSKSEFRVGGTGSLADYVTIAAGVISLKTSGNTATTLSPTQYGGNAATATNATNDGSGNNIVNTYATKAALDALSNKWTGQFKIATSTEAQAIAQGDASALELGYIYLVEDTSASSPNVYDEYIKVALGTSPETYSVEKIGTTDAGVDVVSITTAEINTIWSTTAAAS